MTTILFHFISFCSLLVNVPKDTLNQLNGDNQKTGYWLVYLDENINRTDSINSVFFAYEFYDNGQSVFSFKAFRRKMKVKDKAKIIEPTKKGQPHLLNTTIRFYTEKDGVISREEKYIDGHPNFFKGYNRNGRNIFMKKDTTNYLVEQFDFTKKFEGIEGTHYFEFLSNGKVFKKYWFRKVRGRWTYDIIKE